MSDITPEQEQAADDAMLDSQIDVHLVAPIGVATAHYYRHPGYPTSYRVKDGYAQTVEILTRRLVKRGLLIPDELAEEQQAGGS